MILMAILMQAATPYPADKACTATDTSGMVECQKRDIAVWEARVDKEYRNALDRAGPASQDRLRNAQEMWRRYREANCAFYQGHGGTISHLLGGGCIIRMTMERATELRGLDAGFK